MTRCLPPAATKAFHAEPEATELVTILLTDALIPGGTGLEERGEIRRNGAWAKNSRLGDYLKFGKQISSFAG